MPRPLSRRDLLKLAALAPLLGAASRLPRGATQDIQESNRPNVLLIVFDTLSAKHMSLYGYPRDTTPNLKRFAERATVFHRHYAGGNFTSPGTSSLLTGSYPWTQRGFNFQGTVTKEYESKSLFRLFGQAGYYRLTYTHNWLAALLLDQFRADIDYWKPTRDLSLAENEFSGRVFPNDRDVAITSERLIDVRGSNFGTGSLFLSMLDRARKSSDLNGLLAKYKLLFPRGLPATETIVFLLEDAINWIQNELDQAPRPFFAYIHLMPPHAPYNPRQEFIGRFDGDKYVEVPKPPHPLGGPSFGIENVFRRHYDEEIAYADAEFGRLYDFLAQSGVLDNTFVVFTSDHGEMLERSTRGHLTPLLYEPITHVPLIISSPGQTKRVNVQTPTSCLDLLPTLAHFVGQPSPAWGEGELLPTLGGAARTDRMLRSDRSIFTVEAKSNAKQAPLTKATISMIKDQYKLIHYLGYDSGYNDLYELYDLENDPEELNDLYDSGSGVSVDLQSELTAKLEEVNRPYQHV